MAAEFVTYIVEQAMAVQREICKHPIVGRFIEVANPIPRPFVGTSDIRLIIIGQDPTVQKAASRAAITTVSPRMGKCRRSRGLS